MALFGSDMAEVMTPDGRRITLPAQLAAQFPGLQPVPPEVAQPPALPVAPPVPAFTPQDQQDIAQRGAPTPDTAAAAPVTTPSQVEPSGPMAPRGPVGSPSQASDAGPSNTPGPVTNDQLAKMGVAGGTNAELAANDAQRDATTKQGEALANQADKVGAQMVASEAEAHRLLEERRQVAEANARDMQARTDSYLREAKKVADTKIDRSVDHPILAAIGVALGGVGGAMMQKQHGGALTNPGLDALYKAIDRKVAGQVQDLDQKRQGLATQRDALGLQRQAGMDRLQEMDTYRLGYLEQAKRQVETIKQQTTSNVVRANADVALGGLQQEAAKTVTGAQARWQTHQDAEMARKQAAQQHRESIGVQIRGQDLQQRQHDADRAERSQEKLDEISTKIALAKDATSEKRAKEVREQGVIDPRTGDPLLTPSGADKMALADQREVQARASKDPAQAQKLNENAAQLRQSAQTNDIATARDAKDREKVQGALDSTHNLAVLADKTIAKLEGSPSAFDRQAWADLKASLAVVKARYVATLGERVSVKALEAFDDVLSMDEDSMLSRIADQGKAMAALKELRSDAALNAAVTMKGAGIKSQWKPGLTEEKVEFGGKTAQEVAAGARPGGVIDDVAGDAISDRALESASSRTNAKGKVNSYGLDPADNDKLTTIVDRAASVGHKEYDTIAEQLAAPLTKENRPGFATGVARKIRDQDPQLYQAVMSKLAAVDPAKAKEIDSTISVAAEMPKRSSGDLTDEERKQLTDQRREKTTEEERRKYRKAYDERAAKGTIVRGQ